MFHLSLPFSFFRCVCHYIYFVVEFVSPSSFFYQRIHTNNKNNNYYSNSNKKWHATNSLKNSGHFRQYVVRKGRKMKHNRISDEKSKFRLKTDRKYNKTIFLSTINHSHAQMDMMWDRIWILGVLKRDNHIYFGFIS